MNKLLQRTLMGYRPLYLHGLLLDGQFHLPKTDPAQPSGSHGVRQRTLFAALIQIVFHQRSK
ncbi:hypothetical protein [Rhodanobacter ginsengiterrae]|uniref:hypothetical protein n=1 Tax=Rhodanobacter ginsengiterrae TaxID=2008451 RepID=UPI003CEAB1F1